MTFTRADMPYDSYWRYLRSHGKPAVSIFGYPTATVLAESMAEANAVAGPEIMTETYDQVALFHLALDSTEAQNRLGIWGRPDLREVMQCGD